MMATSINAVGTTPFSPEVAGARARPAGGKRADWARGLEQATADSLRTRGQSADREPRGHAGLEAELARQGGHSAAAVLLTAMIHHMGGAPTSAFLGMYVNTTV